MGRQVDQPKRAQLACCHRFKERSSGHRIPFQPLGMTRPVAFDQIEGREGTGEIGCPSRKLAHTNEQGTPAARGALHQIGPNLQPRNNLNDGLFNEPLLMQTEGGPGQTMEGTSRNDEQPMLRCEAGSGFRWDEVCTEGCQIHPGGLALPTLEGEILVGIGTVAWERSPIQ